MNLLGLYSPPPAAPLEGGKIPMERFVEAPLKGPQVDPIAELYSRQRPEVPPGEVVASRD